MVTGMCEYCFTPLLVTELSQDVLLYCIHTHIIRVLPSDNSDLKKKYQELL